MIPQRFKVHAKAMVLNGLASFKTVSLSHRLIDAGNMLEKLARKGRIEHIAMSKIKNSAGSVAVGKYDHGQFLLRNFNNQRRNRLGYISVVPDPVEVLWLL